MEWPAGTQQTFGESTLEFVEEMVEACEDYMEEEEMLEYIIQGLHIDVQSYVRHYGAPDIEMLIQRAEEYDKLYLPETKEKYTPFYDKLNYVSPEQLKALQAIIPPYNYFQRMAQQEAEEEMPEESGAEELSSIKEVYEDPVTKVRDETQTEAVKKVEALDQKMRVEQAKELRDMAALTKEFTQRLSLVESQLKEAVQDRDTMKFELEETKKEVASLKSSLEDSTQDRDTMKFELEETKKEVASLKSSLEDSTEKELSLKKSLDSTFKELIDLRKSYSAKEKELEDLKSGLEAEANENLRQMLENAHQNAAKEKEMLLLQIQELRCTLSRSEEEANSREKMYKADIAGLQKRLQEAEEITKENQENESQNMAEADEERPAAVVRKKRKIEDESGEAMFESSPKNTKVKENETQDEVPVEASRKKEGLKPSKNKMQDAKRNQQIVRKGRIRSLYLVRLRRKRKLKLINMQDSKRKPPEQKSLETGKRCIPPCPPPPPGYVEKKASRKQLIAVR